MDRALICEMLRRTPAGRLAYLQAVLNGAFDEDLVIELASDEDPLKTWRETKRLKGTFY